ncbi:MAG: diguanylate cyclase [Burkholderiales bacterium]|nr:diguanylate cyclase [Burkholderiales bacterium]
MTKLLRTSIAARSTAAILLIVSAVGFGFLALAVPFTERQENARQQARLNELLDTVQRTVSIACFLADPRLADEVAEGLLSNRTVREVAISAGNVQLAYRRKAAAGRPANAAAAAFPPESLVRNIASPFNPDETVGTITLVPDTAEIRNTVARASWFTALLLVGQIIFIGIGVVMVVIRLITRPISGISARLHGLQAETGQKLDVPRGNETDEIGQLVRDVNAMIDYLVKILDEERELRVQREIGEKKFRAIFDHADTGIFLIDESGRLLSCNPAFAQFFGMPELTAANDAGPLFIDLIGEHREETRALIGRAIAENKSAGQDIKLDGKAGTPTRWVNMVLSPLEDHRLQGVVNDITERKRGEDAAQELAVTDHLTGLGNRLGFERKLEQMIDASYRRPNQRFALLMLDLDWFKQVNDTYGHQAGDDVLIHVARLLEKTVRKSDFVGRVGGDEFVVLLDSTFRREIIEPIIGKIIAGIGQPIPIGEGKSANVGASVGAAIFEDTVTRDELIRRADKAMYSAKESGRNSYRFFEG